MEEQPQQPPPPPPPRSPGVSPVHLKDCMEELVRFTLVSYIDDTLGLDIGLSKDYCSNLLKNDDLPSNSTITTDVTEGVPSCPLYKHLAASLYKSISSGTLSRLCDEFASMHEGAAMKQKEGEWNELILGKGLEFQNMLKAVDFELHVQEPFFSQLRDGLKTVEGRCAVGDYNRIEPGALLLFNKCLVLQVEGIHRYASFRDMLERENIMTVLPGVKAIDQGVKIYRNFYSEEKERSNGVLAIRVTRPALQLYESMAALLSGLTYQGIQSLLGMSQTVGTNLEALPPSKSSLFSSFLLPHNPNVLL